MSLYDRDYMRAGPAPFGQKGRGINAFYAIFLLNIGVFIVQWVFEIGWMVDPLSGDAKVPMGGVSLHELSQWHAWTLFTYMFVHGSPGHILLNMVLYWFAGKRVQELFGSRRFLQVYLVSGLMGAAVEMAIIAYTSGNTSISLIGASAACFGLLTAYAVALPQDEMTVLLYFIIPVRARLWVLTSILVAFNLVLGVLSLFHALPGWLSHGDVMVAYFAHLGGAAAGWYYARTLGYGGAPPVRDLAPADSQVRRRRPEMARVRKPVVEVDLEAARRQNPANDPVVDIMRDEVDPILDKIVDLGMSSLTDDERRVLERASRHMVRREREQSK